MYRYIGSGQLHTQQQKIVNIPTIVTEFSTQTIHFYRRIDNDSSPSYNSVPCPASAPSDRDTSSSPVRSEHLPISDSLTSSTPCSSPDVDPPTEPAIDSDELSRESSPDSGWYPLSQETEEPSSTTEEPSSTVLSCSPRTVQDIDSDSDSEAEVVALYPSPILRCTICKLIGDHDRVIDHIFEDHIPLEGHDCPHCKHKTTAGLERHILQEHCMIQKLNCFNHKCGKRFIRHQSRIVHMKSCPYGPST